jgi:fibro-slime domain-containing protein
MTPRQTALAVTSLVLLVAGAIAFWWPGTRRSSTAQSGPPPQIEITGIVRDFTESHPDFGATPGGGFGHYAGDVKLVLGPTARPEFVGGYKVATQWRDGASRNIAPHLYNDGSSARTIVVGTTPTIQPNARLDSWNSETGPYGGSNVGPAPVFDVGGEMPPITVPTNLGPVVGNITYRESSTISSSIHCNNMTIRGSVRIAGSVIILCEGDFLMGTNANLMLRPDAHLDLYIRGALRMQPHTRLNVNTGDPSKVRIYNVGTTDITLGMPDADIYAQLVAPNAAMTIMPNSEFYGTLAVGSLSMQPNAQLHLDTRPPVDACGREINDRAGSKGSLTSGGIASASTFDEWFRDVPVVNASTAHTIVLLRNAAGIYEILSEAFWPINGRLLGNEGRTNNSHFTFAIDAEFTSRKCIGQFVEFEGGDGAWLCINNQLCIDLGGVASNVPQYIDLDRLRLTDGQRYRFHFFYANRRADVSVFKLRTNLELVTQGIPTITAQYD